MPPAMADQADPFQGAIPAAGDVKTPAAMMSPLAARVVAYTVESVPSPNAH